MKCTIRRARCNTLFLLPGTLSQCHGAITNLLDFGGYFNVFTKVNLPGEAHRQVSQYQRPVIQIDFRGKYTKYRFTRIFEPDRRVLLIWPSASVSKTRG